MADQIFYRKKSNIPIKAIIVSVDFVPLKDETSFFNIKAVDDAGKEFWFHFTRRYSSNFRKHLLRGQTIIITEYESMNCNSVNGMIEQITANKIVIGNPDRTTTLNRW